jgi:hypothetical protein
MHLALRRALDDRAVTPADLGGWSRIAADADVPNCLVTSLCHRRGPAGIGAHRPWEGL